MQCKSYYMKGNRGGSRGPTRCVWVCEGQQCWIPRVLCLPDCRVRDGRFCSIGNPAVCRGLCGDLLSACDQGCRSMGEGCGAAVRPVSRIEGPGDVSHHSGC